MKPMYIHMLVAGLVSVSLPAFSAQWLVSGGYGKQAGATQHNTTFGCDVIFWQHARSRRQELAVGAGYTYLHTDAPESKTIHALSIFPQLSLYADPIDDATPVFFVRALGPSYLSSRVLGRRKQGKHFTFQAQVGVGIYFGRDRKRLVALSYKHFSNGRLFSPNDGIDVPFVLSFGQRW